MSANSAKHGACFLVVSLLVLLPACDDNDRHIEPNPDAPVFGAFHLPSDGESVYRLPLGLSWECSDPQSDPITYDLYFGTANPPTRMVTGLNFAGYVVSELEPGQTYFWKVLAHDDNGNTSESNTWSFSIPAPVDDGYPLEVGNSWEYSGMIYYEEVEIDSSFTPRPYDVGDTLFLSTTVRTTQVDTLLEGTEMYAFVEQLETSDGEQYVNGNFFNMHLNGFVSYGYWGGVINVGGQPRSPSLRPGIRFADRDFESGLALYGWLLSPARTAASPEDSIYWEQPPAVCLQFPLEVGRRWNMLNFRNSLMSIEKEVVDEVEIEVPAGSFECAKIHWNYSFINPGPEYEAVMTDYVSDIGLVKREVHLRVTIIPDNPDGATEVIMHQILELTALD